MATVAIDHFAETNLALKATSSSVLGVFLTVTVLANTNDAIALRSQALAAVQQFQSQTQHQLQLINAQGTG